MAISLQADSTLPQGYILVDGQRAATISTTGLSATLAQNTVTTSALVSGAVTTEKIALGAVVTEDLANGAVTAAKMSGGQSGDAPIYGCRAWVNFNGTLSAGGVNSSQNNQPVLIRASGNVSQVIRIADGVYRVIFTIPMPDNNYAVAGCSRDASGYGWVFSVGSGGGAGAAGYTTSVTTTAVEVELNNPSTNIGSDFISVTVFR
jgi:hypothetical protein